MKKWHFLLKRFVRILKIFKKAIFPEKKDEVRKNIIKENITATYTLPASTIFFVKNAPKYVKLFSPKMKRNHQESY